MPTRKADAVWEGSLKEGKGNLKLGSGAFSGGYSFGTRFENSPGTNPEELIAAAHASCFTMALAFQMTGPQERKTIETWIAEKGVNEDIREILPHLKVGEAHVWSPQWLDIFEKVKIGEKRTYDASATPVFGKVEKAKSLAPVDLEQIQEAMKSTIEKAKAEDPK